MPDIPAVEPTTFVRGNTVKWTKTLSDFPGSTYALTYEFRGASKQTVAASVVGDDFAVTITATQSLLWNPGTYWWEAYAVTGSERYLAVKGQLEVTKNFEATDVVADERTHAKKVLDAIEATIEGRADRDQQAYTIAGRSLQLTPIDDLLKLRDRYKSEVLSENPGNKKRILARLP
jgi:hypothetical protein